LSLFPSTEGCRRTATGWSFLRLFQNFNSRTCEKNIQLAELGLFFVLLFFCFRFYNVKKQITVTMDSHFHGNDSGRQRQKQQQKQRQKRPPRPASLTGGAHHLAPFADSCGLFAAQLTLHRRGITTRLKDNDNKSSWNDTAVLIDQTDRSV
jgi:hypothetical protein